MRKLLLYFVVLFVLISCGVTVENKSYLKVTDITTKETKTDTTIITINFNQTITQASMALINTSEMSGEILGTNEIINNKLIFTSKTKLIYATYKVNVYKKGTMSFDNKTLKENYSYTFTIKPKIAQKPETIPNIPIEDEENKPDITEDKLVNQSYDTCNLIPQMNCDEIKSLPNK